MEEEFVADSEGEGGLELSPPGYGHPELPDASFDHFQPQIGQPGYSPSTISEFPSTLQTTAKQPFESPILDFTATTHSSIVKKTTSSKKSNVTPVEVLDLSSEEESYVGSKPRKPPRPKAVSPSESAYGEPATSSVKSRKQLETRDAKPPVVKDKPKKVKKKPAKMNSDDDTFSVIEPEDAIPTRQVPKKRKSTAKKKLDGDEVVELILEAPKVPSKKRKSPDNDIPPIGKPSKKRKKNSPQIEDADEKVEGLVGKLPQKGRRPVHISDDESADELLLTKDTPVEAKKFKSSAPRRPRKSESIPPDDNNTMVSAEDLSAPSPQVQPGKSESPPPPSEASTSMLPPRQPAKVAPRLSTEARQTYGIPKRDSISDLLRKTGLHAPLSSSKLTRKSGDRIAPLHITRTTPPPPPPPIPKPKKKVVDVDEDEDDFTGMTEKQIAKFLEEKKKKAWYSP